MMMPYQSWPHSALTFGWCMWQSQLVLQISDRTTHRPFIAAVVYSFYYPIFLINRNALETAQLKAW